jgi:hypothetical protein
MAGISHDWQDETLEAKARWFQSLTLEERMEYLVAITDLILENNPGIMDRKNAEPPRKGVRVLKLPQSEESI